MERYLLVNFFCFNVKDACYLYWQGYRNLEVNLANNTALALGAIARSFRYCSWSRTRFDLNEVVFFSTSLNQAAVLAPLFREFEGEQVKIRWVGKENKQDNFKINIVDWIVFHLLFVLVLLFKGITLVPLLRRAGFAKIYYAYLYFFMSCLCLRSFRGLLFLSNDHSNLPRSVMKGAHAAGVRTAYVQHAAVTKIFPPLEFDYAFLDGEKANETYNSIACGGPSRTKIFLFGSPKMDSLYALSRRRDSASFHRWSIAINSLDDELLVIDLAKKLINATGFKVTIRPHPRQKKLDELKRAVLAMGGGVQFCNESLEHFLGKTDVLLASNSSIHLEAVASGAVSLYCSLGSSMDDYYGFVEQGLVIPFDDRVLKGGDMAVYLKEVRTQEQKAISHYLSNSSSGASAASRIVCKTKEILSS